jgi:hypothetical protein
MTAISLPDLVNGLFELLGGVVLIFNCLRMHKDKQLKGVNIWVTVFFNAWGFWNIYYYPHLNQWLSFFGGLSITTANTIWVLMAIYYTRIYKKVE